ncbi:WD40 repeat-like protein [Metschnikowia bicuspidata var. bicuspidata NRRL YB-4993]|uniref:WD40 repeat-like protein n=1 Tax=Metschnikowia bicuspidata var. bicuspidata NRRL YB-4993 TaxID=869754 RepID=A0A1A0HH08_9ASCO|nr:WD40 repeat-like protein [Metschnikowia bicuspidata var. bicuspidata NRRL YB-4993]OBA23281.1 WD40 repeat-like protein [Metschnikowia bicuspidata var. bicuspidata NRRL YB-4993]
MSPPKTAKLRRSTSLLTLQEATTSDRFIPSHKNSTTSKLTAASERPHPNASPQTHIKAQTNKIYQHHVAEACGLDVNSRILSYRPLPPERSKPLNLFSHITLGSLCKALERTTGKSLRPSLASERAKKIPTAPDRVLDAPNIVDDFYLNLVSWSLTNLIVIGLEDAVYVWNASTGSVGLLCETPGSLITSLRWSGDGSYISIGKDDGSIEIWDIETNSRLRTLASSSTGRVASHCWLLHLLTSGSKEGTIYHSDVRVSSHLVGKRENTHLAEVCGIEYRGDGQQFCSGGNDNVVAIWDARNMSGDALFQKTNHRAAVKAMAWCPYQSLLLATGGGTSDKSIHFWNTSTGARVNLIETESQISSLNWGYAKGTGYEVVATHGYPSNSISLFNYPTLQKTGEVLQAHDSRILNGCLSPDGTTLATVSGDENLKFWSLFDFYRQARPDAEESFASNDGKHMGKLMNIR